MGGHRSCTGLSDLGRRQSATLAARLAAQLAETQDLRIDVLLTSHFRRAVETAELLRPAIGDAEIADPWPEFGEQDPGPDIDGMTFEGYVERFGTPDWSGNPDAEIFPGGETTADLHRRVRAALSRLIDAYPGRRVAVSCHGGVIDAAFRIAVGLPVTGGVILEALNTSITEFEAPIESDGRWRLVCFNDAAHLAGLPAATERATP